MLDFYHFFFAYGEDDEEAMAVQQGLDAILPILGENFTRINEIHPNGFTLLQIAVYKGDMDMVKFLLDKGADANLTNEINAPALVMAVERNFEDIVKILLERGADIDKDDYYGNTALHRAVETRNASIFKLLLDNGADIKEIDNMGCCALELIIKNRNIDLLKMIYKPGDRVNLGFTDRQSARLMRFAVERGNREIVQVLLDNKVFDVNKHEYMGETALLTATKLGVEEIVMLLLDRGASVKVIDSSGNTLLHCAVMSKNTNIFKLMMKCKIDVNIKNSDGLTAMTHAISGGCNEIIRILLDSSAKVVIDTTSVPDFVTHGGSADILKILLDNVTCPGWSHSVLDRALVAACVKGREEIVKILLERGARVNNFKANRTTALHLASENGHESIVKILLDSGANVHAINELGMTALHEACKMGHYNVVKLLVNYGSDVKAEGEFYVTPLKTAIENVPRRLVKSSKGIDIFCPDFCNYFNIVKFLLQVGANVCGDSLHTVINAQNYQMEDFMLDDWFKTLYGPKTIIELFLDYGIRYMFERSYNVTRSSLLSAVEYTNEAAVQLFLDYGVKLNDPLDDIINYVLKCSHEYRDGRKSHQSVEIITRHVVKMKYANLAVSEKIFKDIDSNDNLKAFKVECESEIERMMSDESAVPFWRILKSNHTFLANFARNEEIVRVFKSDECKVKFPIYSSVLKNQLRRGIWRSLLLSKVQHFFKAVGESEGNEHLPKLPALCVREIFSYLRNRDFRSLIRVCDPHNHFDLELYDIKI